MKLALLFFSEIPQRGRAHWNDIDHFPDKYTSVPGTVAQKAVTVCKGLQLHIWSSSELCPHPSGPLYCLLLPPYCKLTDCPMEHCIFLTTPLFSGPRKYLSNLCVCHCHLFFLVLANVTSLSGSALLSSCFYVAWLTPSLFPISIHTSPFPSSFPDFSFSRVASFMCGN